MTTTIVLTALVLLFIVALLKRFIKFAVILAVIGLAYWFFVR